MKKSRNSLIRLIAIFKLFKASLLIAVGVGALRLFHKGGEGSLEHWVAAMGLRPGGHYLDQTIGRVASIPPEKLRDLGLASFVYAALFLTEGMGLWLMKRWAEWFTVAITASLVPLEFYEIDRHPTIPKVVVLVLNIVVVVYLVWHIRRERSNVR